MGQQPSKGYARFDEIIRERERVFALLDTLRNPAADEKTAGLPGGPGSHQARYEAAINYLEQLWAEQQALEAHLKAGRKGGPTLPMPDPTPPLILPPPPKPTPQAMSEPAFASGVQLDTAAGAASSQRGQQGESNSSEGGGAAGGGEGSQAAPLLATGTARLAPAGFRRRAGRQECS